jgi:predicted nucleic acid-binding protein
MPVWAWIVIAVVVALVVLAAIAVYLRNRQTARLQERFGPEYQRTVAERGDQRSAEKELAERERQREKIDILPLSDDARGRYVESWRAVQTRFVDDPAGAVGDADRLITDAMRDRGYPIEDFEQRAADLSVDHPNVVEHYRAAHAIHIDKEQGEGDEETEDLRQAFVHYRALFEELVETNEPAMEEARK